MKQKNDEPLRLELESPEARPTLDFPGLHTYSVLLNMKEEENEVTSGAVALQLEKCLQKSRFYSDWGAKKAV